MIVSPGWFVASTSRHQSWKLSSGQFWCCANLTSVEDHGALWGWLILSDVKLVMGHTQSNSLECFESHCPRGNLITIPICNCARWQEHVKSPADKTPSPPCGQCSTRALRSAACSLPQSAPPRALQRLIWRHLLWSYAGCKKPRHCSHQRLMGLVLGKLSRGGASISLTVLPLGFRQQHHFWSELKSPDLTGNIGAKHLVSKVWLFTTYWHRVDASTMQSFYGATDLAGFWREHPKYN